MTREESGPRRRQNGTAPKSIGHSHHTGGPERRQSLSGEDLKLDAHAFLEARRELFILRGRRALLTALLRTGRATADDVRDTVELPDSVGPKLFGPVPGPLARVGIIELGGSVKSRRPDAHGRPVSVWRLRDRQAAQRWLSDHPDRPDPVPTGVQADPTLFDLDGSGARR